MNLAITFLIMGGIALLVWLGTAFYMKRTTGKFL